MLPTVSPDTKLTIWKGGKGSAYCLNRDVFLVIQDDIAQLLDFNRGKFYGLDSMSTLMVSIVLEQNSEDAVAHIVQTYDVTEEQVRTDLTELLQNLECKRLLVAKEKQSDGFLQLLRHWEAKISQSLGIACFSTLRAVNSIWQNLLNNRQLEKSRCYQSPARRIVELLLTLSWLSFRLLGWSTTISLWQKWHRPLNEVEVSVREEIVQIVDRVVRESASWKLFFPIACKERALVGYHILRAFYGLPATLIVGISHYPFRVHAWVECDGRIITDDPPHCQPFTPIVRYS